MTMTDWIAKLDDFLKLGDRDILTHAGRISHEQAIEYANQQFEQYRLKQVNQPSQVERDFEEAVSKVRRLEQGRKTLAGSKKGKGKK
jgi:hypothetical protein